MNRERNKGSRSQCRSPIRNNLIHSSPVHASLPYHDTDTDTELHDTILRQPDATYGPLSAWFCWKWEHNLD